MSQQPPPPPYGGPPSPPYSGPPGPYPQEQPRSGMSNKAKFWIALGILAGTAVLFILAAGACVALLVAYSNGY